MSSFCYVNTFYFCVSKNSLQCNTLCNARAWVYDTELLNRQIFKIATSRRMLRVLTSSPFFFSNEKIPSQQVETASIILKNVCIKRCLKCCKQINFERLPQTNFKGLHYEKVCSCSNIGEPF